MTKANTLSKADQIIVDLDKSVDLYIADPTGEHFELVEQNIAASYDNDGEYTEEELNQMDFKSAAQDYIARRLPR